MDEIDWLGGGVTDRLAGGWGDESPGAVTRTRIAFVRDVLRDEMGSGDILIIH